MRTRLSLLVVSLISLWSSASAQQPSSLELLESFPSCAQRCLINEFLTQSCSPTNTTCICTNQEFQSSVSFCVTSNCTIPDALFTKNISTTNCNALVRDRGKHYYAISYVMIILSWVFIITRFMYKIYDKLPLELDDWTILATAVVGTASSAVIIGGTIPNGLGRDLWKLEEENITTMLKYFYIVAILYFADITLLKLSILFFYIKVFTTPSAQRLLWGTVGFTFAWGAIYVIVAIFQCRPISYFWNIWDGLHDGKCLNINAITSSNAGISIALDLWSLAIPLWELRKLKLHWKKKVGVGLMFIVGTFVTVVSILRLQSLVHFAQSDNVSWEFYDVSVWSTVECGVGMICTCLPTIRLLFVKMFPILGGSSNRSEQHYRKYETDSRLGRSGKSGHSQGTSSRGSMEFPHRDGIVVKTSYTVDRSRSTDVDEISVVEKHSPNSIKMDDMYKRNHRLGSEANEFSMGGRNTPQTSYMHDANNKNIR